MDYSAILDTISTAVASSDTNVSLLLEHVSSIEHILHMILDSIWIIWIADRFVVSVLKQIFGTIS